MENGNITDITVLSYEDDKQYFSRAVDKVTAEIINSQSTEVDAVSGVTFSSNGIMESVSNALNVSYTNPNSTLNQRGMAIVGKTSFVWKKAKYHLCFLPASGIMLPTYKAREQWSLNCKHAVAASFAF